MPPPIQYLHSHIRFQYHFLWQTCTVVAQSLAPLDTSFLPRSTVGCISWRPRLYHRSCIASRRRALLECSFCSCAFPSHRYLALGVIFLSRSNSQIRFQYHFTCTVVAQSLAPLGASFLPRSTVGCISWRPRLYHRSCIASRRRALLECSFCSCAFPTHRYLALGVVFLSRSTSQIRGHLDLCFRRPYSYNTHLFSFFLGLCTILCAFVCSYVPHVLVSPYYDERYYLFLRKIHLFLD
jgi:hypothetical protein